MTRSGLSAAWVRLSDTLRFAIWGLLSRPVRSATVVGSLAAGVAAVVLAVGIIRGYGEAAERAAYGVYARSLVIRENVYALDRYGPPILSDIPRLHDTVEFVDTILAWRTARVAARSDELSGEVDVFGVYGDHRVETGMEVAEGRGLSYEEAGSANRVCLLGEEAAERFFPGGAVGESLSLGGISCEVIGILEPSQARTSDRFDRAVIAPFTAAARYFQPTEYMAPDEASWMTVVIGPGGDLHDARVAADRALRRARGVPMSRPTPYSYDDPGAPRRAVERERALLGALLSAIAAVSMLAALIGYSGVLMSSINERSREIATRMAIGARTRQVVRQFFAESLLSGLAGGGLGGLVGIGLCVTLARIWDWEVVIDGQIFLIALTLGLGSGAVCGLAPAWRVSTAMPWHVLRQ